MKVQRVAIVLGQRPQLLLAASQVGARVDQLQALGDALGVRIPRHRRLDAEVGQDVSRRPRRQNRRDRVLLAALLVLAVQDLLGLLLDLGQQLPRDRDLLLAELVERGLIQGLPDPLEHPLDDPRQEERVRDLARIQRRRDLVQRRHPDLVPVREVVLVQQRLVGSLRGRGAVRVIEDVVNELIEAGVFIRQILRRRLLLQRLDDLVELLRLLANGHAFSNGSRNLSQQTPRGPLCLSGSLPRRHRDDRRTRRYRSRRARSRHAAHQTWKKGG